jgi:hypothetical protein
MSANEQQNGPKQPYQTPEVQVYGTVEELTHELGSSGPRDNNVKRTHSRSR